MSIALPAPHSKQRHTRGAIFSAFIMLAVGCLINLTHILPTNIVATKPNQEMLTDSHLTLISQNHRVPGGNWSIDLQFSKPKIWLEPEFMISGCIRSFLLNDILLQAQSEHCLNAKELRSHLRQNISNSNSATLSGIVSQGSFGFLFLPNIGDIFLALFVSIFAMAGLTCIFCICRLLGHDLRESWYIAILIVTGGLLRAWSIYIAHPLEAFLVSDMKIYAMRADQLLNSIYSLKLFFQPIGFSLYSALMRLLAGHQWHLLKLGHLILSTVTLWIAWRTCLLLFERNVARWALFLLTFAVSLWSLASFHLSETLYTFLVVLLAYFIIRNFGRASTIWAIGVGLSFALGFFVKSSLSFFFPVYLAWNFFVQKKEIRIQNTLTIAVAALLIALFHGLASFQMVGQFKLGADAGGLNFIEGKCPSKQNIGPDGEIWLSPLFGYLKETQVKKWPRSFSEQGYYWREGFKCIEQNPQVLLTSVRYIYYLFWGNPLWPSSYSIFNDLENIWEWIYALLIAPFVFVALLISLRKPREPQFAIALMILGLFLTAYIFKSELRFRVPFDVILIPMALHGLLTVYRKLKKVLVSSSLQ